MWLWISKFRFKFVENALRSWTSPFVQLAASTVEYRRMFLTETGLIGLASFNAELGDLVVAFHGCNVPFLLRRDGEGYKLVGESYGK